MLCILRLGWASQTQAKSLGKQSKTFPIQSKRRKGRFSFCSFSQVFHNPSLFTLHAAENGADLHLTSSWLELGQDKWTIKKYFLPVNITDAQIGPREPFSEHLASLLGPKG